MKIPIWLLILINIILCLFALVFIIYPNFYFGLTKSNYIFIILINLLLVGVHVFSFFNNKKITTFFPLIISLFFYLSMYLANIVK